MTIKLLASDLDGTLLNSSSEISEENLQAIRELSELGVEFVPSTGRAYSELDEKLRENDSIRYYICSGGAVVYDKLKDKRMGEYIGKATIPDILKILLEFDGWYIVHSANQAHVQASEITEERFEHYEIKPYIRFIATDIAKAVDDIPRFLRNSDEIEMIAVCFKTEEEAKLCESRLLEVDGISVLRGTMGRDIHNVEIVSAKASKGNMLIQLASILNIKEENVAAVGDSPNDLSMIRAVKNSFAVSNAKGIVKSEAKQVVCSNDSHVVKYLLENYVKTEKYKKTKNLYHDGAVNYDTEHQVFKG